MFKFFAQRFAHQAKKPLSKMMVSPRLPYQVLTADMFPPTNNKKASLCPNLKPQTHKHHWQALLRHPQLPNLSRDPLLLLPLRLLSTSSFFLNINWARESLSSHIKQLRFGGLLFYLSPLSFFTLALGSVKWSMQGVEIQHRYGRRWEACDLWSNNLRFVG